MKQTGGIVQSVIIGVVVFALGALLVLARSGGAASSAPPSPTPTAAAFFWSDTTVIPAGGCVTLSWSAPNAGKVVLQGSNWPEGAGEVVDSQGSATVCPSAALNYVPDVPVDYRLTVTHADGSQQTNVITIQYEGMAQTIASPTGPFPRLEASATPPLALPGNILPPAPSPTFSGMQPTAAPLLETPYPTPDFIIVVYQPFEHGFMLQRAGEACVFSYVTDEPGGIILSPRAEPGLSQSYAYCTPFDALPILSIDKPEVAALMEADTPFTLIWTNFAVIREALGLPTESKRLYEPKLPPQSQIVLDGIFYMPISYLPDGRLLECGWRAATAGTCDIR